MGMSSQCTLLTYPINILSLDIFLSHPFITSKSGYGLRDSAVNGVRGVTLADSVARGMSVRARKYCAVLEVTSDVRVALQRMLLRHRMGEEAYADFEFGRLTKEELAQYGPPVHLEDPLVAVQVSHHLTTNNQPSLRANSEVSLHPKEGLIRHGADAQMNPFVSDLTTNLLSSLHRIFSKASPISPLAHSLRLLIPQSWIYSKTSHSTRKRMIMYC